MKRVFRLLRADSTEVRVFVISIVAMGVMRVALAAAPLKRVIHWIRADQSRWAGKTFPKLDMKRAVLRITQATAYCPLPTTCLSRTLAAHMIMSRLGFSSVPKIGVSTADGGFAAHAWLECQDGVVIGEKSPDGRTYTPLPSLERFFA
jgi:hypothetical protein